MQWNLRMVAAQRGVWRSSELRRALAEAGLAISAGKMSHLWSATPISIRLTDLDVICSVLNCQPNDLLIPDDLSQTEPKAEAAASNQVARTVSPSRRRGARSLPPV